MKNLDKSLDYAIELHKKGNIEEAKNYWLKAIKNIDDPNEKEALQVAIDAIDLVKNQ